ncbi:Ig-like domain-containing protein [Marinicrinis lubricantis]|uniref:Ig domain-containing protein n=1 Tax=Marinicrinis lubricantis TaxID=2086470 RepID=A0ABW1ISQ8_9BACL
MTALKKVSRSIIICTLAIMVGIGCLYQPVLAATELAKLALTKNEITLAVGDTFEQNALAVYSDGSTENVSIQSSWSSENSAIASVYNGTITAKSEGTVTMLAVYKGLSQSFQVHVTKKVKALTKNTNTLDLQIGESQQIELTATYSDNTTEKISNAADWQSSNEKVATVLNGKVTALKSGTTTITASYGQKTVSVEVSVDVVKRIDANVSSLSLLKEDSQPIELIATYPDGSKRDVTLTAEWSSSNDDVADVLNGTIHGYSSGEATITAAYGTKTTTITVEVDQTRKLVVSEQNVYLKLNEAKALTLKAVYPDGSEADVTTQATWSSSNENVAYVHQGKVTGESSGSAIITASYSNKSVQIAVDVSIVKYLDVSADEISMSVGSTEALKIFATYADGSTEEVTQQVKWNSDQPEIADIHQGAIRAYAVGQAKLSASYGGRTVSVLVNVDLPSKLNTSTSEVYLMIDEEYLADAVAVFSDGSEKLVSDEAEWTTDQPDIVSVKKGTITGLKNGSATVKATYGDKTVSIKVGVESVRRIEPSVSSVSLLLNEKETIVLMATFADGRQKDITTDAEWSSSDKNVAEVSNGVITALASGTSTITASYGEQSTTITVDVDKTVKLEVSEQKVFLHPNDTHALKLKALYPSGTTTDVTNLAKWSTDNEDIAYVKNGNIFGVSNGTVTVTAEYSNKTVKVEVDVAVPRYLDMSESKLTLKSGEFRSIKLTATYADGSKEDVTNKAKWSSDDEEIVYADSGKITAYSTGEALVKASYNEKTVSLKVSVDVPVLIRTDETNVDIQIGEYYKLPIYAVLEDGNDAEVTEDVEWSTGDAGIAKVVNGKIYGVGVGSTKVKAKYFNETIEIVVNVGLMNELTANARLITLATGETYQVQLTGTNASGTTSDITKLAKWSSNNKKAADVSSSGLITALGKGTATITAEYGGKTITISVEVDKIDRLEASVTNLNMKSNDKAKITVKAYFSDGTSKDVTTEAEWATSKYKVAVVDNGVVTAVGSGDAKITVKYAGKSLKIPVEVDKLKYLVTSEVHITLKVGQQKQVRATATYTDLKEANVTVLSYWESSNIFVATAKDGVITATGKGRATITVEFGDKKTKINVTVVEK